MDWYETPRLLFMIAGLIAFTASALYLLYIIILISLEIIDIWRQE